MHRTVFFISDSTGITAETIGNSILAQFEGVQFDKHRLPFTDNAAQGGSGGAADQDRTRRAGNGRSWSTPWPTARCATSLPPAAR